jgi:hypothetical protein
MKNDSSGKFAESSMKMPNDLTIQGFFEVIRNQQCNLVDTIFRLLKILESLPEGANRKHLLEEISCLDGISEMMRRIWEARIAQRDDGIDMPKGKAASF